MSNIGVKTRLVILSFPVVQIPHDVTFYIYYTLACGVSPFLYVLGMSEFRHKVEELVDDACEGIRRMRKNLFSCQNKVHPVGAALPNILTMENENEEGQGPSSDENEENIESALRIV